MSKLTLDDAIKHCLETAEQLEERANAPYKCEDSELQDNACRECAADHRQLAEWLTDYKELKNSVGAIKLSNMKEALELIRDYKAENITQKKLIAEYKRLLKAAVEGFEYIKPYTSRCDGHCNNCPFENESWCRIDWKYADEAEKLLEEG